MTAAGPRLTLPVLALALAACAPPHGAVLGRATPLAPSPTPTPRAALVAVLDHPFGATPNTLRLLRPDGAEVAETAVDPDAEAIAVAGPHVLIAGAGRVEELDSDGTRLPLPTLPGNATDDIVRGLVADPGGTRWLWSSVGQSASGAVSRLYLGSAAAPGSPSLLLEKSSAGAALQPVAWTRGGPVVSEEPLGIGGYVLFRRTFGATSVLDLVTHALRPLTGADCAFSDMVADGSYVCVADGREGPHGNGPVTLRLVQTGHAVVNVALPSSVQQAGAAFFSPDGSSVSLGTSPALGEGQERMQTALVDVATGAMHAFGPDGIMPAAWLPDGRLVAMRMPGVAGGEVGTYLLDGTGTPSLLTPAWTVLGVLQ